jgi:hypothetical protein
MQTCLALLAAALVLSCMTLCQAAEIGVQLAPPVLFFSDYGAPRLLMAGDADADGKADAIGFYPDGEGILDYLRTSSLGKPTNMVQARRPYAGGAVAVSCGDYDGRPGVEVAALLPDGTVRVAAGFEAASRRYQRESLAVTVPAGQRLPAPCQMASADLDGDGRVDLLAGNAAGRLLWLRNETVPGAEVRFAPVRAAGRVFGLRRLAAGDLDGCGRAEVVWTTASGRVRRADLRLMGDGGAALTRVRTVFAGEPGGGLAVGRFTGGARADVLCGQHLLPGGGAEGLVAVPTLPAGSEAAGDLAWVVGDFTGDGLDDLLRYRRSGERFVGDDVLLQVAYRVGETPTAADSDGDGLWDSWETGAAKPGGLDLAALGCSLQHADVVVEVSPMEGVADDTLRSETDRIVAYYASLPMQNPDGRTGLALHPIFLAPVPKAREGEHWGALGASFHAAAHRGVTHWMLIGNGGGGQSSQMGDRGSCGIGGMYATFIHEFGHQLGLDHTGHWGPAWCPTYSSLMNYAYSYQLNGKGEQIAYSTGKLAGVTLNETRLSERVRVAPGDLQFLSGPPYRFNVKADPEGSGSLVDWNWNGVFGEESVRADINYSYSTYAGVRQPLGKSRSAPVLVAHGEGPAARLLLLSTERVAAPAAPKDAPAFEAKPAEAGAEAKPAEAGATKPPEELKLTVRVWVGTDARAEGDRWSRDVVLAAGGVTGDPTAAYAAGATWVAWPTAAGVKLARVTMQPGELPVVASVAEVPDTPGVTPTLTTFEGSPLLLLWRGEGRDVGARLGSVTGGTLDWSAEEALPLQSRAPVGAAQGAAADDRPSLWVGLTENQDEKRPCRWQVRQLVHSEGGTWTELGREWVGGEKGQHRGEQRVMLLWEPSADYPEGQLYFLQCGMMWGEPPSCCHFIGMRVKDTDTHGGWLVRRYYDEWSTSRSGPAACFFRGDIAYATRWFAPPGNETEDNLQVGFFGRGIDVEPMGDFDDVGFIRDIGLPRCIPCAEE